MIRWNKGWKLPVKTAIAAALSTLAYQALHLKHGYWAPISAIIVMQSNLGSSIRASIDRLIGTALGAAVGAVVWWALGRNAGSFAIAVAITMWICVVVGLQNSLRLAGVTVAIVVLVTDSTPWQTAANRFTDVALGIVITLAVNLIWPARAAVDLRRSLAETFTELGDLFKATIECALVGGCPEQQIEALKTTSLRRSRRNYELVADVHREPGASDTLLITLAQLAERIRDHIYGMDYPGRALAQVALPESVVGPLRDLFSEAFRAFQAIAADLRDRPNPTPHNVEQALDRVEAAFNHLRETGQTRAYSADELLRFYAFLFRARQLIAELARTAEFANALEHAPTP